MISTSSHLPFVFVSHFKPKKGVRQSFIIINCESGLSFDRAAESVFRRYNKVLSENGLSGQTQIFSRLHISDFPNQIQALKSSDIYQQLSRDCLSIVEQKSVKSGAIALFSYHITSDFNEQRWDKKQLATGKMAARSGLYIQNCAYPMLWMANYAGSGILDSKYQSEKVLESVNDVIHEHGMTPFKNGIRTWVYVRDIDNHYKGMVDARRNMFKTLELTDKTRYLASTGIQGGFQDPGTLVSVDCLCIDNLESGQVVKMEALENLPPTISYGVTFERGLKLRFGDHEHFYISGTASINQNGEIMYPNDVVKQTRRTFNNIEALLRPHGADLTNMAYFIVYLRDTAFFDFVRNEVTKKLPNNVPVLFLEAPVCRPGWLVEIEGEAFVEKSSCFPNFC